MDDWKMKEVLRLADRIVASLEHPDARRVSPETLDAARYLRMRLEQDEKWDAGLTPSSWERMHRRQAEIINRTTGPVEPARYATKMHWRRAYEWDGLTGQRRKEDEPRGLPVRPRTLRRASAAPRAVRAKD